MKKKLLNIISTISLVFVMALSPLFIQGINSKSTSENLTMQTRTVEVSSQMIDLETMFLDYEDVELENSGYVTTVYATKTFNLLDFEELDLVANTSVNFDLKIKYTYSYDSEKKLIFLSAKLANDEGVEIIDTLVGAPFVNEEGNFDAVFDCDGELILLSELQDAGMIENCGWLRNLCKKVKNVAKKVANTVKTAAKAVGEFVHNNAEVIVPLAIGVVGGLVGCAAGPILLAGTIAGAAISGGKTAYDTYKANGKIDWTATGISAGIGAAVGFVATYTGYNIGSALRPETSDSDSTNTNNATSNKSENTANNKLTGEWKNVNESMSDASRNYQTQITGRTGQVYIQNGVKFDGVVNGNLVDAKCHYAQFIDPSTGKFYEWFNGQQSLIDEANRQIAASNGAHIQWYFAEEETLNAVKALFEGKVADIIEFIFKAPK